MGIDNYTKYSFDNYITLPLCEQTVDFWHELGFIPNGITLIHIILKVITLALLVKYNLRKGKVIVLIIVLITYLDALDGFMARKYNQYSVLGEFLDGCSDLIFWLLFGLIIISQQKRNVKLCFSVFYLLIILSCIMTAIQQFEETSTEPTQADYIWSAISWNIIPLTFVFSPLVFVSDLN